MSNQDLDIAALARGLASRDGAERDSASAIAATLDDDARTHLLRTLLENHATVMRWVPRMLTLSMFLLIGWLFVPRPVSDVTSAIMMGLGCSFFPVICYISFGPNRRLSNAIIAATLPGLDYSRAVGSLVEATNHRFFPPTRKHAHGLLEKAVEDLAPGEPCEITQEQVRQLAARVVNTWNNSRQVAAPATDAPIRFAPHTMTIIKLLAKVGNRQQMETLERLTRRRASNDTQIHIRNLILELLPGWKARIAEQTAPDSLLRGASEPEAPATLLRAAAEEVTTPSELLRTTEQRH